MNYLHPKCVKENILCIEKVKKGTSTVLGSQINLVSQYSETKTLGNSNFPDRPALTSSICLNIPTLGYFKLGIRGLGTGSLATSVACLCK